MGEQKCFVDSNVWLYALIKNDDPRKSKIAGELITRVQPIVSTQVINEVCANLLRKKLFNEQMLVQLIESFYDNHQVVVISREAQLLASELRNSFNLSFWDSHIAASAITSDCEILYSEDMQHGLMFNQKLRIVNPFVD